jgi:hypothetical protein
MHPEVVQVVAEVALSIDEGCPKQADFASPDLLDIIDHPRPEHCDDPHGRVHRTPLMRRPRRSNPSRRRLGIGLVRLDPNN